MTLVWNSVRIKVGPKEKTHGGCVAASPATADVTTAFFSQNVVFGVTNSLMRSKSSPAPPNFIKFHHHFHHAIFITHFIISTINFIIAPSFSSQISSFLWPQISSLFITMFFHMFCIFPRFSQLCYFLNVFLSFSLNSCSLPFLARFLLLFTSIVLLDVLNVLGSNILKRLLWTRPRSFTQWIHFKYCILCLSRIHALEKCPILRPNELLREFEPQTQNADILSPNFETLDVNLLRVWSKCESETGSRNHQPQRSIIFFGIYVLRLARCHILGCPMCKPTPPNMNGAFGIRTSPRIGSLFHMSFSHAA